jgi:hypothetical protein
MIDASGPAAGHLFVSASGHAIQRRAMPSVCSPVDQNGMSSSGVVASTARLVAAVGLATRAFGVATAGTYFFTTAETLPAFDV